MATSLDTAAVPLRFPGDDRLLAAGDESAGLPAPPGPLIGRDAELAGAISMLGTTRLLTLTGPAGVGKSRLALAVAEEVRSQPGTKVCFVDLATLNDASLVLPAVAAALAVRDVDARRVEERLRRLLVAGRTLLFLDGFEHVLAAALSIDRLLADCRGLTVLATSRAPLRLRREQILPVPPLALPDPARPLPPDELGRVPATALFVARARSVAPGFTPAADEAEAIAGICRHLDGLPLAIELAAVRVRLAAPAAILADLKRHPTTLGWDAQDAPARHRTLRAAIGWSYDALTPSEQTFFRRLAVFEGGWTVAAASAVAGAPTPEPEPDPGTLAQLGVLVDKSLIATGSDGGEPRFSMLGTLRAFALAAPAATAEVETTRARHMDHFLALAEASESGLVGPDHADWLRRLERDHDNLRAALREAVARGEIETGLRLAGSLFPFMVLGGHIPLGQRWLERLLTTDAAASTPVRAKATRAAGWLRAARGELAGAETLLAESLALVQKIGDADASARARDYLAAVNRLRGVVRGSASEAGPGGEFAEALGEVGDGLHRGGATARAAVLLHESVALGRQVGLRSVLHRSLDGLADAWSQLGYPTAAAAARAEALGLDGNGAGPEVGRSSGPRPSALSPRERQVLRLVAAGAPDKEIARELGIAVRTVRVHITSIFAKLGVGNRAQAVAVAMAAATARQVDIL